MPWGIQGGKPRVGANRGLEPSGIDFAPMNQRWKPSVTVAAIAARVHQGLTQYLLVEEHTSEGLRLNNPAGHLEPGESPEQGAVREALEESACVFTPAFFMGVYLSRTTRAVGDDTTYVRLAFAGTVGEVGSTRRLDDGIVRTLWLTLDEVRDSCARHRSPLVLRCIEDHAAGRFFPLASVYTDVAALEIRAER
jgi:8-oxo-dGTP pyrophosphatase MutT (NUDIX family)